MPRRPKLSVALIGTKFMGRAHSNAWRQAPRFFDLPADIEMVVICGRDRLTTRRAARTLGWEQVSTDWRTVVSDPRIEVIDICTPNDSHAEIAIAAAKAGKAILCEKPLARDLREAQQMAAAVERAGVPNMVCHNYRRLPAIALAKQLIDRGYLGDRIYHFHARYAQDWLADENFPLLWRLQSKTAGSGALGDLSAHVIDLARYLVGHIASVAAISRTFITKRQSTSKSARSKFGKVDVDDAVSIIGQFRNGAMLTLEATRFAYGRKNQLTCEINGSRGSLIFDLEKLNRLRFYNTRDPESLRGFRNIIVTDPSHPYASKWWPPGHLLGYEHTFIHTVADFIRGVVTGKRIRPDFADGLETQRALDAISRSAKVQRTVKL